MYTGAAFEIALLGKNSRQRALSGKGHRPGPDGARSERAGNWCYARGKNKVTERVMAMKNESITNDNNDLASDWLRYGMVAGQLVMGGAHC
jgi:hypothetical protein